MKKYKLIKEYPGSPKLGYIWEMYSGYKGDYHRQPEYWEEIIEKDYEILSLTIHDDRLSDMTGYGSEYIEALLKDRLNKIHSVKRLSDGEIFTIGDNITYNNEKTIIEGFNLQFNKYLIADFKKTVSNCIGCNINYIQKAKQPLFTTEDGIDIFEGSKVYYMTKGSYIIDNCIWNSNSIKWAQNIHFSTKEKAQEYIDLNKPKYSLNDILSVAKDYYVMPQSFIDKLKQLNK